MTREAILQALRHDARLVDAHTHVGADPALYLRGEYPYCLSGEDLALRLAAYGIDAAVCFPMLYTSYFDLNAFLRGRIEPAADGASAFPYEVENRNLCDEVYNAFPELAGKLLPFAFFDPSRSQAEQAAAIRDLAAQYPLFGLKTATSYMQSPIMDLLTDGACLLDLAAELDLPVTIHTAVLPGDPWANVFEVLRVVRARADVRFDLAHTCRFDRRALDATAELPNCFVDVAAFHIHCMLVEQGSEAVATTEYRFPADYREHATALCGFAEAYPDTLVWGSDTPYHQFKSSFFDDRGNVVRMDLACAPATETCELRRLSEALQRRIGHTNTLRWLAGRTGRGKHEKD